MSIRWALAVPARTSLAGSWSPPMNALAGLATMNAYARSPAGSSGRLSACHGITARSDCHAAAGAVPKLRDGRCAARTFIQYVAESASCATRRNALSTASRARATFWRVKFSMSSTLRTRALPCAGIGLASCWISAIRSEIV